MKIPLDTVAEAILDTYVTEPMVELIPYARAVRARLAIWLGLTDDEAHQLIVDWAIARYESGKDSSGTSKTE